MPLDPAIPAMAEFGGTSIFSSRYPPEGFDFTGRRVALIGTGSTGVQIAPVLAGEAEHLFVFQRSAAYTFPTTSRPFEPGELDALKARYPEIRTAQREARPGTARISAFTFMANAATRPRLKQASRAEQLAALDEFGLAGALYWSDVTSDMEASDRARALYGEAIARIVEDPDTVTSLIPTYPFGCKRPIVDNGYFEMFNRDNVTLVDLRKTPIERVTPTGIQTASAFYQVDVIFYATGFDAMTGALTRIDVRGRDGVLLRDRWTQDGPGSYLGLRTRRVPKPVRRRRPGQPRRPGQRDHLPRASDRLDRRLPGISKPARSSKHRGRRRSPAGMGRPHGLTRRRHRHRASLMQLMVDRRKCPGEEAILHVICRGDS